MVIESEAVFSVADLIEFLQRIERPDDVYLRNVNWASLVGERLSDGSTVRDVILSERELRGIGR